MIIFLVANGKVSNLKELYQSLNPSLVIAVNGGANKSLKNKVHPNIIIGDNDSLRKKINSKIVKFPKDKDKNDFDLAIDYILENFQNFKLFCFGAIGNRIDHTLANLYSLSRIKNYPPSIITSNQTIYLLHPNTSIHNIEENTKTSILSIDCGFSTVEIHGFKYSGIFQIPFLSSLGISNYSINRNNSINCRKGLIIVIIYRNYLKLGNINVRG